MIKAFALRSFALVGLFGLTGLTLQGCVSTPHPPVGATPQRAESQMAPIPNPPEVAKPPPPSPAAPSPPPPRPAAKPAVPKRPPVKPAAPATVAATDRVRAAKLRASGLEQLNRGAVDKAVGLLQQALALDPGNALIQRDLDRALRVSQAVHAKP
jgi:hypothetical protein